MKKLASFYVMLVIFALTAFQCENGKDCCVIPPPCGSGNTLTGTWKLDYYQDVLTEATDLDPQLQSRGVVYTFSDTDGAGKIEGHTTVNTVSGTYTIRGTDCAMQVTAFGGTKVNEPAWSKKAWLRTDSYYVYRITGDKLILKANDSNETLVFKKVK